MKTLCKLGGGGGDASHISHGALRLDKAGHVCCAVRTESLNPVQINRSFKGLSAGLAALGQLSRLRRVEEQRFPDVSAELPFFIRLNEPGLSESPYIHQAVGRVWVVMA